MISIVRRQIQFHISVFVISAWVHCVRLGRKVYLSWWGYNAPGVGNEIFFKVSRLVKYLTLQVQVSHKLLESSTQSTTTIVVVQFSATHKRYVCARELVYLQPIESCNIFSSDVGENM